MNNKQLKLAISKLLTKLRFINDDMEKNELAANAGVDYQTIYRMEMTPEESNPTYSIYSVAAAFKYDLDEFFRMAKTGEEPEQRVFRKEKIWN